MFILKCAEQTSSCTSRRALCVGERERKGGIEMYLCSVCGEGGAMVQNTHCTVFLYVWLVPMKREKFIPKGKACIIGNLSFRYAEYYRHSGTRDRQIKMLWRIKRLLKWPQDWKSFNFSCLTCFAWLEAEQVIGIDWAKLCRLPIKSNVIIHCVCVCVFVCVCLGRLDGGERGGGTQIKHPIWIRTIRAPKRSRDREGGNSEAIWLANQPMHICMLITWQEGGKSGKRPPMRQTGRGRGRKDIADTREKRGGRATEQMDKQTKKSKGAIDEMGN